jgi:cytochrome c5
MKKIPLLMIISIIMWSCKHDAVIPEDMLSPSQSEYCNPDTVYFVNDIQPLLNSTCATTGCHDDQTAEHGVRLTSYSQIIQTGEVKPFRPEDSELYEVLFGKKDNDIMPPPPQSPLTSAQKQMIYDWIMQGAQNNECTECNTEVVSFAADVTTIITNNCLSCHSGANPNAGVLLTNYSEIATYAQSGLLMNVLTGTGAPTMPPTGQLDNCSIDKIQKWINDGSPNN